MRRIHKRSTRERSVYQQKTRDILVRAAPTYSEEQSHPEKGEWLWTYTIEIENHGLETVQLVSRHWIITDGLNRVEEVEGSGVVGEQPILKPRQAFRYSSACPLSTSTGAMRGSYRMITDDDQTFDVAIPEFSLDLPGARRVMN